MIDGLEPYQKAGYIIRTKASVDLGAAPGEAYVLLLDEKHRTEHNLRGWLSVQSATEAGYERLLDLAEKMDVVVCDGCATSLIPGTRDQSNTNEGIERCDMCELFEDDLDAALALAKGVGGAVRVLVEGEISEGDETGEYNDRTYRVFTYEGTWPEGLTSPPESGSDPWVEVNGEAVDWTTVRFLPEVASVAG